MRLILALIVLLAAWPAFATPAASPQKSAPAPQAVIAPAGLVAPETGKPAPDFTATDTLDHEHKLSGYKGKVVVLEWTDYQCPYVKKHYDSGNMQSTQQQAADMGAIWLRIISSAPGQEGYMNSADVNRYATEKGAHATGTILDEAGTIGKLYAAKTTPTLAVIDTNGDLVYEGAIDDKPTADPDDIATAKNYVKTVLADLKAGRQVSIDRTQAYGCGIKYAD